MGPTSKVPTSNGRGGEGREGREGVQGRGKEGRGGKGKGGDGRDGLPRLEITSGYALAGALYFRDGSMWPLLIGLSIGYRYLCPCQ